MIAAAVLVALVAAGWAGWFALAEESPSVGRALGDRPRVHGGSDPYRNVFVARTVLLLVAGLSGATAVAWWRLPPLEAALAGGVAIGLLYMVGEALPRAVAALAPDVAGAAVRGATRTATPFQPLASAARAVTDRGRRWLPMRPPVASGRETVQRDLLLGVFSLGETTVAEIMTPRLDVDALASDVSWNDVVEFVRHREHARIPVYSDTLDTIEGILYAKDLVAAVSGVSERPDRWQDYIRPAHFVPESKTLDAQLRDFQRGPAHIAVVVDEFGGTSGIVTLEDTLEEIVGEIRDEYDEDERPAVRREGDDKFWVDGGVTLDELEALLGITIALEDVNTVGGFVYAQLGHVPVPGETFRFGEFRVIVEQVIRRRVHRVYFERSADPEADLEAVG